MYIGFLENVFLEFYKTKAIENFNIEEVCVGKSKNLIK